jgi:hypothetical protein
LEYITKAIPLQPTWQFCHSLYLHLTIMIPPTKNCFDQRNKTNSPDIKGQGTSCALGFKKHQPELKLLDNPFSVHKRYLHNYLVWSGQRDNKSQSFARYFKSHKSNLKVNQINIKKLTNTYWVQEHSVFLQIINICIIKLNKKPWIIWWWHDDRTRKNKKINKWIEKSASTSMLPTWEQAKNRAE